MSRMMNTLQRWTVDPVRDAVIAVRERMTRVGAKAVPTVIEAESAVESKHKRKPKPKERTRSATGGAGIAGRAWFLPYVDTLIPETAAMREAYRHMLADPVCKSALETKILSVASLDWQVQPGQAESKRSQESADFVGFNIERLPNGMPGLIRSMLAPALIDGFSICEKVYELEKEDPKFRGKVATKYIKSKDTQYITLEGDEYSNVTHIHGDKQGSNISYPIQNYILTTHMPLFESPLGMSDCRAAYPDYWMHDTVKKLRAMAAEKNTTPFLLGTFDDDDSRPALETALTEARASTWMAVPEGVRVEAVNIAGSADGIYKQFCDDCQRRILIAITGAYLQTLEGQVSDGRGSSSVAKSTTELFQWMLLVLAQQSMNRQWVPDLMRFNYHKVPAPKIMLGGISEADMSAMIQNLQGAQQLGLQLSKKKTYEKLALQPPDPEEPDDVLQAPGAGGGMGGGLGGLMGGGGGFGADPNAAAGEDAAADAGFGGMFGEDDDDDYESFAREPRLTAVGSKTPPKNGMNEWYLDKIRSGPRKGTVGWRSRKTGRLFDGEGVPDRDQSPGAIAPTTRSGRRIRAEEPSRRQAEALGKQRVIRDFDTEELASREWEPFTRRGKQAYRRRIVGMAIGAGGGREVGSWEVIYGEEGRKIAQKDNAEVAAELKRRKSIGAKIQYGIEWAKKMPEKFAFGIQNIWKRVTRGVNQAYERKGVTGATKKVVGNAARFYGAWHIKNAKRFGLIPAVLMGTAQVTASGTMLLGAAGAGIVAANYLGLSGLVGAVVGGKSGLWAMRAGIAAVKGGVKIAFGVAQNKWGIRPAITMGARTTERVANLVAPGVMKKWRSVPKEKTLFERARKYVKIGGNVAERGANRAGRAVARGGKAAAAVARRKLEERRQRRAERNQPRANQSERFAETPTMLERMAEAMVQNQAELNRMYPEVPLITKNQAINSLWKVIAQSMPASDFKFNQKVATSEDVMSVAAEVDNPINVKAEQAGKTNTPFWGLTL